MPVSLLMLRRVDRLIARHFSRESGDVWRRYESSNLKAAGNLRHSGGNARLVVRSLSRMEDVAERCVHLFTPLPEIGDEGLHVGRGRVVEARRPFRRIERE